MIIDYEGQKYLFDLDEVTMKQGLMIEKFMGCSFTEWGERLLAGGQDLRTRQALGWVILSKGDLTVPIEDTDFKMGVLGNSIAKAVEALEAEAKAAAEAEPVPTGAVASNGHVPAVPAGALSPPSSPPSSGEISR
jgi:hypothetical protein